jgi:UDP-N-acetylmuramyl pentapeptide phosphotransferase/UDP-N-acetylglucosamine-1-phosphate transferase
MNMWLTYGLIAVILVVAELVYFRIADKCNIIEKPNERSSHSTIVLRGGGIIFAISILVWYFWFMINGSRFKALRRAKRPLDIWSLAGKKGDDMVNTTFSIIE